MAAYGEVIDHGSIAAAGPRVPQLQMDRGTQAIVLHGYHMVPVYGSSRVSCEAGENTVNTTTQKTPGRR